MNTYSLTRAFAIGTHMLYRIDKYRILPELVQARREELTLCMLGNFLDYFVFCRYFSKKIFQFFYGALVIRGSRYAMSVLEVSFYLPKYKKIFPLI